MRSDGLRGGKRQLTVKRTKTGNIEEEQNKIKKCEGEVLTGVIATGQHEPSFIKRSELAPLMGTRASRSNKRILNVF